MSGDLVSLREFQVPGALVQWDGGTMRPDSCEIDAHVEVIVEDTAVVRVRGQVDISNVELFRSALERVMSGRPSALVVDLSSADYIDSSGLAAIMFARHLVYEQGGLVVLVASNPNIRHALTLIRVELIPGMSLCDDFSTATTILQAKRR